MKCKQTDRQTDRQTNKQTENGYSGRKHDLLSKFSPLDYPWGEDGYLSDEGGDKSHLSLEGNGAS